MLISLVNEGKKIEMRQVHPFIQRYYEMVRYKLVREHKCGAEIRRKTQQIEIVKVEEPKGHGIHE